MTERRPQDEAELVEFVRAIDVRAPERLHDRIDALIASRPQRRARAWSWLPSGGERRLFAPALAAAAVVALVLALVFSAGGGSSTVPTLRQTASLALLPALQSAPGVSAQRPRRLDAAVEGVAFPYWSDALNWRATGARRDRLAGRSALTVYYASRSGATVGYAILGGTRTPQIPGGGRTVNRGGVPYHLLSLDGAHVVAWLRDGRQCVLAGHVGFATLVRLASFGTVA